MLRAAAALLSLALALPRRTSAGQECKGLLTVNGMGQTYVMGSGIETSGGQLTLQHNSGISITSYCHDGWDPNGFKPFSLLGNTLSYTADLSRVGCGCNVAVYLVQEPARDPTGNPSKGTCDYSPYYCDANMVCGQWCPEMDIMEANRATFAATPHKCDPSPSPKYTSCDRGGQGKNTKDMGKAYGPGAGFTIDTTRPFEVHTKFDGHNSSKGAASFIHMTTTLEQGGNVVVLDTPAAAPYLGQMADSMDKGMSLRITYWGDAAATMKWLDGGPCGEQSCSGSGAGTAFLSNFRLTPNGVPLPPPKPAPRPIPVPVPTPAPTPAAQGTPRGLVVVFTILFVVAGIAGLVFAFQRGYFQGICPQSYSLCAEQEAAFHSGRYGLGGGTQVAPGFATQLPLSPANQTQLMAQPPIQAVWDSVSGCAGSTRDAIGALPINAAMDRLALREAWDQLSKHAYSVLREPLQVGDRVVVQRDFGAPGRFYGEVEIRAGTQGTVEQQLVDASGSAVVIRFDGHQGAFMLRKDEFLNVETEGQSVTRRNAGLYVLAAGLALVVVVVIVLAVLVVHLNSGGGAPTTTTTPIPVGGCCSWKVGVCGQTTTYCEEQAHCTTDCQGKWLMPK